MGEAIRTEAIESAHAALGMDCFLCQTPGHIARTAHTAMQLNTLSTAATMRARAKRAGAEATAMVSQRGLRNGVPANDKPTSQEAAGVATTSLSHDSHNADIWLCDSGTSSSMSNHCSAFSSFRPDQRAIRVADGKVIHSRGGGTVRFLSESSYFIIIHNVYLFRYW